jgi:hypothetical protein
LVLSTTTDSPATERVAENPALSGFALAGVRPQVFADVSMGGGEMPPVERRLACTGQTDQDHAFRHGLTVLCRGQCSCSTIQQHPLR